MPCMLIFGLRRALSSTNGPHCDRTPQQAHAAVSVWSSSGDPPLTLGCCDGAATRHSYTIAGLPTDCMPICRIGGPVSAVIGSCCYKSRAADWSSGDGPPLLLGCSDGAATRHCAAAQLHTSHLVVSESQGVRISGKHVLPSHTLKERLSTQTLLC
jgi:hypothetical protein